ncbi:MAG TPA: NAD(P)-dependent oxidoreductase [Methylomirabilota bacterium]|nr:NAD(P)-dependent oxidoreductase [Methylomirabilota bacterium]
MKILVTGNLGYIGPVLTAALMKAGHVVHGYDSALFAIFATHSLPPVAHQTLADLRDERSLATAIRECDAVIHLAAMSNDPLGELEPTVTRSVNLDATLRLMNLAADRRLVFYSSASVYGANAATSTEGTAVQPLTLYSELKVKAETAALQNPRALVLRNGTVHGPAPVIRGDLLLNAMVASAVTSGEVVLMTAPSTRRPVIDVRDLCALTVSLIASDTSGLYNSAATNTSVGEAAALVSELTSARLVERHDGVDPRDYAMDTSRLRALVGSWWKPRPLAASVRDLVAHYREIGLTAHDVSSRRYHRLAQYQRHHATVSSGS